MALARRSSNAVSASIWPGFVDAMTALLLVLMFVLSIFMIVQFVLRDTITGQDQELNSLSVQLSDLASALGLAEQREDQLTGQVGQLENTLSAAEERAAQQVTLITSLTNESQSQQARIADFETQVATLLSQNTDLTDQRTALLADKQSLEDANAVIISEREAVQLALAKARDEIDAGAEIARLAAAKREAMESLIASLETTAVDREKTLAETLALLSNTEGNLAKNREALSASEAALLLARGDLKSTQDTMTTSEAQADRITIELNAALAALTLSQAAVKDAQAEQTLTKENLDATIAKLTAGLSAAEQARLAEAAAAAVLKSRIDELAKGLTSEEEARLAEVAAAQALREKLKNADTELTAMTLALEAQRKKAEDTLTLLAAAELAKDQATVATANVLTEREREAALLAQANKLLGAEQAQSADSQRKVTLLNQQTEELRKQLNALQGLLDASKQVDEASEVEIAALGANLNTALAQVASEQKHRAELEARERERLEAEAVDLQKFRSEFFGRLREVLGGQEGIRIVGDRFVFSSEILFGAGSAELGERGQVEIAKVASIIQDVADQIPPEIDWILRVDGHTDKVPLSGFGKYTDNWELSQARALSVVKYLIRDLDIPASRLAANGFGEFQPIVDGTSPEALALNRRIELKFTEK